METTPYKLKTISKDGIAEANAKAERYRFLNQPQEAESICRDVLAADPENQLALRNLGLAITDQFTGNPSDRAAEAERLMGQLKDKYENRYYSGIVYERLAKSQLAAGQLPYAVYGFIEDAMECFKEAEALRPPKNDDALLHWNFCVRILESRPMSEWQRPSTEPAMADF
jgi:tetratricopeptide (TPR) repeat protein